MPTPGAYVLLKERPVRLVVAMIILPDRVCLEDPKVTVPDSRSKASNTRYGWKEYTKTSNRQRRDSRQSGQRHDPRANTSTQSRDLHYSDMYVTEEQQCDTPFDHDCGLTYSLEAQVHIIATSSLAKRYFTTLSLSTTGSAFTQVKFKIDTAATCNTSSLSTLFSRLPDAELKRSLHRLYPYGNYKPLEPEGQVDLVCLRQNKYETLTFQVLPDSYHDPPDAIADLKKGARFIASTTRCW